MAASDHGVTTSLKPCAVKVGAMRTSIRLEPELWEALHDIGRRECLTRSQLLAFIANRRRGNSLSSAIRVFISTYYWELFKATGEPAHHIKHAPGLRAAKTTWAES